MDQTIPPASHDWQFFRVGGFDQVRIDTGADLLALEQLDQKLWVALSCPVSGIEFDARTLQLIDTDGDGHIRAPEIVAAVKWAAAQLKDADLLVRGAQALPLDAINDGVAEGRNIRAAALRILAGRGKPDAANIAAEDTADSQQLVAALRLDGDGVIPADAVEDAALRQAAQDIIDCCGTVAGRGGKLGIDADIVARFFDQAEAVTNWHRRMQQDDGVLFLGTATLPAADAYRAVRAKIEDYFMRCRMAAYDQRAAAPLSRSVEDYQALAGQDLSGKAAVQGFPLAVVAANQPLPLREGINPAWQAELRRFDESVLQPLFGAKHALGEEEWLAVQAKFDALEKWFAQKPENTVDRLGIERLQAMLDAGYRAALLELIAQDKALAGEVDAVAAVERLVRYCRDLHELVNNFVSFRNFYTGSGKAVFQAGTLYLDGRSCELCVPVADINKHAVLANLSRVCLVYCECKRGQDKMTIAAAFTAGDADQLMVGRNGVFYDRKGQDWDAVIVRMLEHPISIRQAFWSPYKRAAKMISEQIQKFAAARSQAAQSKLVAEAVAAAGKPGETKPTQPPFDVAKFAGIFAAIGLAVGALGTAVASVITGILNLDWWQIPLVLVAVMLTISGPSMLIAWFKLKQRNLGPLLDANGWAVNARAKINIPFGTALTGVAKLPEGAARSLVGLVDPFAEKKRVWPYFVATFAAITGMAIWVLWLIGFFK